MSISAVSGVLRALAERIRPHRGAVPSVRHPDQANSVRWALIALLPALPASAASLRYARLDASAGWRMLRRECARCRAEHPTEVPREVRLVVEPGKDDGLGGPVVGE